MEGRAGRRAGIDDRGDGAARRGAGRTSSPCSGRRFPARPTRSEPEFVARFVDADAENARFFRPSQRDGHSLFDLPAYIVARLKRAGIGEARDVGLCTYSDEQRFFSYRRATHRGEPDYGRNLSAIALAGD